MINNEELIQKAASVIKPRKVGEFLMGDVGCALVTDKNNIYLGVSIDTGSGMGFCAEHNALGSMITANEYKIKKIVAVWKNDKGDLFILSPCGRCREFMRQTNKENLEADILLGKDRAVKLKELLPYNDWFHKL